MLRTNEFRNSFEGTLKLKENFGKNVVFGLWKQMSRRKVVAVLLGTRKHYMRVRMIHAIDNDVQLHHT